ncbi:hypothetical protein [Burkholderia gladioli]|uniref:hypothetical protein n=1 Tax=Burkholderia gladioli TaxID=28095 RepID=UPI00163FF161|nr:hypothetical protein [Burkholderia gladioli]
MLPNKQLLESLDALEVHYKTATGPKVAGVSQGDPSLFCKHAALELCGWLEELQDYVALQCGASLSDPVFINSLKVFIGNTYGFDMKTHFLPMISFSIGAVKYEEILNKIRAPGSKFTQMEGIITNNQYKQIRNRHAHTYFDASNHDKLQHLNSPAVVKQHAIMIYDGFKELYVELKNQKLIT